MSVRHGAHSVTDVLAPVLRGSLCSDICNHDVINASNGLRAKQLSQLVMPACASLCGRLFLNVKKDYMSVFILIKNYQEKICIRLL